MKVDNSAVAYNVIDMNQNISAKQTVKEQTPSLNKVVELNTHDQTLITENRLLIDDSPSVDVEKVAAIKAQIQSGQLEFNMKDLAKALVDLGS